MSVRQSQLQRPNRPPPSPSSSSSSSSDPPSSQRKKASLTRSHPVHEDRAAHTSKQGSKSLPRQRGRDGDRTYINFNYLENGAPDVRHLPLEAGKGKQYRPLYVNVDTMESDPSTGMRPQQQASGGRGEEKGKRFAASKQSSTRSRSVVDAPELDSSVGSKPRARTHQLQSHGNHFLPASQVAECSQCKELLNWLSLWELGVSGLTRQYSQILAQLNRAKDASLIIECRVREERERERERAEQRRREEEGERGEGANSITTAAMKSGRVRSNGVGDTSPRSSLADQMYPPSHHDNEGEVPTQLPPEYAPHFVELTSRLSKAIDLCQQLAASSFKTERLSNSIKKKKRTVMRQTSSPLTTQETSAKSQVPSLSVINETSRSKGSSSRRRPLGGLSRMKTEPVLRGLDSEEEEEEEEEKEGKEKKGGVEEKGKGEGKEEEEGKKTPNASHFTRGRSYHISSPRGEANLSTPETRPTQDLESSTEEPERRREEGKQTSDSFVVLDDRDLEDSGREGEELGVRQQASASILSQASTFSDTDVKQVMSKIALLEDERLKLLETIDKLQTDNQSVRLSLYETLGDLENKDLQLTLAMQDLSIATDEIRRVATMRAQLEGMESERENLLGKLNNLEDESAAVKVSLVQLLQEKSATNKTLVLENWRLRQKMHPTGSLTRGESSASSVSSRDAVLPEPYIMDDDLSNYVHKQGFLVKQGRRVKNWKRRLFVLDSDGLSYFKTEQPIQKVPLSQISKVCVCRNHTESHMFEVHTPERVFFLSAPSEDEMQSWVGMLQTLKQYSHRKGVQRRHTEPMVTMNGVTGEQKEGSRLSKVASLDEATPAPPSSSMRPMSAVLEKPSESELGQSQGLAAGGPPSTRHSLYSHSVPSKSEETPAIFSDVTQPL